MSTQVNQGQTADLVVNWDAYPSGPPADVSGLTITVNKVSDASNVLGPTSAGVVHQATGLYTFQWAVSTSQAVGDYVAVWNATYSGSAVQASEIVTVRAYNNAVFLTWCDITLNENLINAQGNISAVNPVTWVSNVTGSTLTPLQIQNAQQVLNMFSNYTPESSGFNMQPFDLMWLRYGLAYQAVWMPNQPGLLGRNAVTNLSQDGLSVTIPADEGVERVMMLAPLALRSLKQLSWQKSRSLRVRTPFIDDQTPLSSDPDAEANDLYERWVDMYNFGYRGSSTP
jgi:hypothetical protein